jgi:hypothetical protein
MRFYIAVTWRRRVMHYEERLSPCLDFQHYCALHEFNEPDDPLDEEDDDFEDGGDELAGFAGVSADCQFIRRPEA